MRHVILNFHGLDEPGRALEPGEAPYWLDRDWFEDILRLVQDCSEQVETTFTFDDGNLSDLTIGAEALAGYGWGGTFFVLAGRIGQEGSLSAEDIRTLQTAGHHIGSHGADHVDWRALDGAGQMREWDWARAQIADVIEAPVEAAAIPFGRYDGAVLKGLQSRGYTQIYSSDGGAWRPGQMPIPRTSPRADMSLQEIEDILLGREPLKKRLRRTVSMALKKRV